MVVAGEASADQHGAALVRALHRSRPEVRCWGAGGVLMRAEGFEAVVPAEQLAVAGLTEVLLSLPRIWSLGRKLAAEAAQRHPAAIVLIDLPDFNLRLAKRLAPLGIPVVYYVSPQIWAWRQHRVAQIKQLVTQMLCILPFEQTFYQKHGVSAQFVGHPLAEEIPTPLERNAAREELGIQAQHYPVLALVPGSRPKEVKRHLPAMLQAVRLIKRRFPGVLAVIPVASTIPRRTVQRLIKGAGVAAMVVEGQASQSVAASDAAMVCSGTATLQTALLNRPMVVVYKLSWLSYVILRRMVKVPFISLVNLIANRRVVPELIQGEVTAAKLYDETRRFLEDPAERLRLAYDFNQLRQRLGDGHTAAKVAAAVLNYVPEARRITRPLPGTLNAVRPRPGSEPA